MSNALCPSCLAKGIQSELSCNRVYSSSVYSILANCPTCSAGYGIFSNESMDDANKKMDIFLERCREHEA